MGSTGGKYHVEDGNSLPNRNTTLPAFSPNSKKSKKENASLPTFLHQHLLTDSSSSNKDDVTLVWLDTEINNEPSNIDIQIKLKNLSNYLRIFDGVDAFEQYITQIGQMNTEKLFLIISTTLALTMIPYLHKLPQIKSIYIYGTVKIDPKVNQQLSEKYPKVKGIFSKCRCLISQITADLTLN